ncbi:MAG: hypothetical protein VXW73_02570, partial [Actinomycetota bacterium]|nr:hypothetical protein [Actinomycetota bacterium]
MSRVTNSGGSLIFIPEVLSFVRLEHIPASASDLGSALFTALRQHAFVLIDQLQPLLESGDLIVLCN